MTTTTTTTVTYSAEGFAPAPAASFLDGPTFGVDLSGATAALRADTGRRTLRTGPGSTVNA